MKLYGLSGGPGSGKSTAADFFRQEKVCVIDADEVCASIYREKDNHVLASLRERWGKDIFDAEGFADKKKIAGIIFNDAAEREFLDRIMHPEIFRRIEELLQKEKGAFAILEAALLFESSWDKKMFRTITVWCDPVIRMERLLQRNWSREHAQKRIDSQWSDDLKLELADYGIINNGSLELLYKQCSLILEQIRKETA